MEITDKQVIEMFKDDYGYVSEIDDVTTFLKNNDFDRETINFILYKILLWNIEQDKRNRKSLEHTTVKKEAPKVLEDKTLEEQKIERDTKLFNVSSYVDAIKDCDDDDFITEILPSIYDSNYQSIISSILLYFFQEITLANSMLKDENDLENIDYLSSLISHYKNIIKIIKEYNLEEENDIEDVVNSSSDEKTRLIFIGNSFDSLYIDSDIEEFEYQEDILPILDSIINGKFSREKRFHNNDELKGISAIRRRDSRIVFTRLDKSTIVVLGIFIKRFQNLKTYNDMLASRNKSFKAQEDILSELVKDSSFISKNEDILNSIIERFNSKGKSLLRSDNNGTSN